MLGTKSFMRQVHSTDVLSEEFMEPIGLTVNKLALGLHLPAARIGEIVHERRRIAAVTALANRIFVSPIDEDQN